MENSMFKIKSINYREILNSHVQFANEFIIEFDDGSIGVAGSSQGETVSIYEDKKITVDPVSIIRAIVADGYIEKALDQETFDDYLQQNIAKFGRNNSYALSEAFFNATRTTTSLYALFEKTPNELTVPRLCLNILNGGWHAYTNPVLSDFHEYILVAKSRDIMEVIDAHNEIQHVIKEKLNVQKKTIISGNSVNSFAARDNRACFDFLLEVCEKLGFSNQFELMVDASASDLWKEGAYRLEITDGTTYSSEEFQKYWLDMIRQYKLRFLEDPFHERDYDAWRGITTAQQACYIVGDNFYSSDPEKIKEGAEKKYANAVIIKPNQAGTVTAVRKAIEMARKTGHFVITSHRSISTESTFLSALSCFCDADAIKIGPLLTDYSSVLRLNEILRISKG